MTFPVFQLNNDKYDAGSVRFAINGKRYDGIMALNYTSNHESGDVYGVGGAITGYTKGIYRGGTGTITMYYEDFTQWYNRYATANTAINLAQSAISAIPGLGGGNSSTSNKSGQILFYSNTYELNITYQELFGTSNKLTIQKLKPTSISQTYTMDSSEALMIDVSFKFIGLNDEFGSIAGAISTGIGIASDIFF